jgi:ribosomal protein L3 glutamine methyltransferase
MTSGQKRTLRQWIHDAAAQFDTAGLCFGHGTDNALDESAYLLSHALKTDFNFQGFNLDAPLSTAQEEAVTAIIKQRVETRQPAAYITHEAWFAGYPFYVDNNVLVPRSPLAELIEEHFQPWITEDKIHHILELGTGSGCIAIACALHMQQTRVDACDIDQAAIEVAQKNVAKYALEQRVSLYQSDLFHDLPQKKYDIIISNPPYVGQAEFDNLPEEYTHEPSLGLVAGEDGLDCVRIILREAVHYLQPHGILIVEVGNSQHALQQAYPKVPFTWLEFEHGGEGVFLLDASQLTQYSDQFNN